MAYSTMRVLALFCFLLNVNAWTAPAFGTRASSLAQRTTLLAGPATLEPPVKEKVKEEVKENVKDDEVVSENSTRKGGWAVRLFNDPMNKREFVAMCLSKIVGLSDGQAYQVMMQAHQNGVSVVGRFDFERAELYKTKLVENGLSSDMVPVEED